MPIMLFPFNTPSQGNTPTQTQLDVDDVTKRFEETLERMNDTDNPPTNEERQELSEKMMKYMKEMGEALQHNANPVNPVIAGLATPFKSQAQTGRTLEERFEGMVRTKRSDRKYFDEKQKTIFYEKFVAGLPEGQGFRNVHIEELTKVKENDGSIRAAVDILRINERIEEKLMLSQSEDIFKIRIFGSKGAPLDIIDVKSLFKDWMHVTAEQVITSCNCFSLNTDDKTWNDDLLWSHHTVLSSIEDKVLKQKVMDRLDRFGKINRTGPLTLYLTLKEVAFCNDKTVEKLSRALISLGLDKFPDESTDDHGAVWMQMITFLKSFNKVPVDAKSTLLEQYLKCTVPAFRGHFNTLFSMQDQRLNSVESIIEEGQYFERHLKNDGRWTPNKKQSSVFMGKETPKQEPSKPEVKEQKGSGKDKTKKPTHDKGGNPIDRHPPKPTESHERVNSLTKRTELWCGHEKCQRWGNHVSKDHDEWRKKFKASMKKRQETKKGEVDADKKKEAEKPQVGAPLTVPRSNFVGNVGQGFAGPF